MISNSVVRILAEFLTLTVSVYVGLPYWMSVLMSCCVAQKTHTVHVASNLIKSDKFREILLQNPMNCRAASRELPAPCPWIAHILSV